MALGFIMAKRYVLSKKVNESVEKFLPMSREGRLSELSTDEAAELAELKNAIS